ncbi:MULTISPECIES: MBL fold metallo-hydrolase [unclassified Sphingomonas]|uniref:MBL fold metallo-hydrolase n=1 Tax=unclassified Sphingomonas TaxID=196159 RepID=UPI000E70EE98|nr:MULTISPECIES: MBL fold metallo-hydrolase [unclassified Sphingomonas]RKE44571.1 L-ascorbate metabolism protein UlaG (beta-lactamase superfamily) [Sphingomonas sp. PP-CC-1A-547]TCM06361.1 L-ascorbate metabolism protein UlaG (beta-lactamase superfamily) [Sphingomonas sp. PP-CC-3G-468]
MTRLLKIVGGAILLLVVIGALIVTIVPQFLDRIYYRGSTSSHFDGSRFFNPDGDADIKQIQPKGSGGGRASFFWKYFTGSDGRPAWPKSVAVNRIAPPARVEGERMVVTWVGHASVLIQTQGLNILTDPVWAEKAGPLGTGPRRVAAPGIAFDALPKIDVVLVSHNHYDHLDEATLKRLWERDRPRIVTSLGNDSVIGQTGAEATALDWGQRVAIKPGVAVTVTLNHHWGSRWFTDRNRALWSSFVVTLPGGNVFFAGDTGMGDGQWPVEAAALGPVRLALIPIGAFRFVDGQMESGSHIGPVDAVEVYRRLGAAHGIPIHWGTFRLSFEGYDTPPKLLAAAMRCTGQTGFAPVTLGRPTEVAGYVKPAAGVTMSREALLKCLDTPAVRALR